MLEKFSYTTSAGKKLSLPRMENVPFGLIRRLRKEDDTEQFFALIEGVAAGKDLAVIDTMTQAEVKDLMDAWQKDSTISLGESSGS
ncbi:hypothetical protein [Nocardia terpenica]|uniref:Tail assembly chaperone n=1 Tax=Nocardia terpenica TaxID=455432 RepID=A0A164HB76_9NOCA|nr:hypothetical protein [Nocardia terpenica]KZM68361.1 hypothetical protein AWN90_10765 [Nocardia terpenica]NQE88724.1 hypothetical protein [Nocardia terpenica]